jgi:hypothetical protein
MQLPCSQTAQNRFQARSLGEQVLLEESGYGCTPVAVVEA